MTFLKKLVFYTCLISIIYLSSISSGPATSAVLPLIAFRVNDGNNFTNQIKITVEIKSIKLSDSLVAEMKIGLDPGLNDVDWIPYSTEKRTLTLTGGDGEKYIYARLKDVAGNISPIESTRIILDTSAPEDIQISINDDEKYSGDDQGRVLISIRSPEQDLDEMMFSNRQDLSDGKWEKMAGTKKWIIDLSGGDGTKVVYARFKDRAGNISQTISDEIILDTHPPENGSVIINDNARFTREQNVVLRIQASNDAAMVRIVSTGKSETIPYKVSDNQNFMEVNWILDSLQGTKVVRVYFMDEAKNRTTSIIQDEIILDRAGPDIPIISINGENRYTNNKEGKVNLRLGTRVNPLMIQVMLSNYMDFHDAKPQNFRDVINNWQLLAEEDGMKTVYVKFIDEAGNHSEIGMAKIILDREPPKIHAIQINEGSEWATSVKVTISMDVEGASHLQVNNTNAISNMAAWERFEPQKVDWGLIPGDGPKVIYLRFKDESDNISEIVTANVILDTKPPTGEVTINNGAKYVNSREKMVSIQINSEDAKGIQISNKPDFTDIKLEPFTPSVQNWVLEGEDGVRTIFIRLRDEAGNFSNVITSAIYLDRQAPDELNLVINEGKEWLTNAARKAAVQLSARGASHFVLSENPEFTNAEWEPFKNVTTWEFSEGENEKELFAKFKDPAENISEVISAKIKLDYTAPTCEEFQVNDGSDFCNHPQKKVELKIKSQDAVKMAISNEPISDPNSATLAWEEYVEHKEWTLEGEDGLKTIYLVLMDEAGNFSGRYNDRIILDRIGPLNPTVTINANQKYVPPGGRKIPMEFSAEGADKIFVSEDENFGTGRWEMFVPKKVFEVSEGDGTKNIYIKFMDKAMNESEILTGSIILDTTPPETVRLEINNGEKFTNQADKKVNLTIEAKDALEMRIIQKGHTPGDWEPYTMEKLYTLLGEDGDCEIGIAFRDEAGNISKPITANIVLDRVPPRPESLVIDNGQGWTNDPEKKVTLHIKADGAFQMIIATDPSFSNAQWESFKEEVSGFQLPGEDGEKIIFIRLKDETGNVSPVISSKINLKRSF